MFFCFSVTMDGISLSSTSDRDLSFHTLIDVDKEPSTQLEDSTRSQQTYGACSLFVNHWTDGGLSKIKDLDSAGNEYKKNVEALKEKVEKLTESSTVRLATTSSNHTVTSGTLQSERKLTFEDTFKDYLLASKHDPKYSSYRKAKPSSSYRPEFSTKSFHCSSHRS